MREQLAAVESSIASNPGNAFLHYQLGVLQWRAGRVEAWDAFRKATELDPSLAIAHRALATWSLARGLIELADTSSQIALKLSPLDRAGILTRALVLEVMGHADDAWQLIEPLVRRGDRSIPTLRLFGRLATQHGQQELALQIIQQELSVSNRSTQQVARLSFTAAELLDSVGEYDRAFDYADRANRLSGTPYDPAAHERTFDALIRYFTREKMATLARAGDLNSAPVFIVGMPRSRQFRWWSRFSRRILRCMEQASWISCRSSGPARCECCALRAINILAVSTL